MEVILSSTKAQTHFYGKLTGVILVALTQIFIYGVAFVLGYSQLKNLDFMKSLLSGISPQSIFSSTFIFTLGFFIIGILVLLFWQHFVVLLFPNQRIQQKQFSPSCILV